MQLLERNVDGPLKLLYISPVGCPIFVQCYQLGRGLAIFHQDSNLNRKCLHRPWHEIDEWHSNILCGPCPLHPQNLHQKPCCTAKAQFRIVSRVWQSHLMNQNLNEFTSSLSFFTVTCWGQIFPWRRESYTIYWFHVFRQCCQVFDTKPRWAAIAEWDNIIGAIYWSGFIRRMDHVPNLKKEIMLKCI